ncbi:glyoxalase [Saccharothrix mutabilis subsp. mutabilis]|uniref:Glyoxalase n=1 Tax=Saccharothrix mutabilis subsp. mutabilis TaxID=66855 RepID=A0ABP3DXU5_9PSEU
MTNIASLTLDVADTEAAERFYTAAFGLDVLDFRASDAVGTGFRGFVLALTVSQPSVVDSYVDSAVAAGATVLKPAAKSLWGYGGVVQAPDGAIWKVATSAKKDTGPVAREVDEVVLLLGVADVVAAKKFYAGRGLAVGKSFGRMYVEFATGPVKLALYRRRALAKDVGVAPEGDGSHGVTIGGDSTAFTDLDGFTWTTSTRAAAA